MRANPIRECEDCGECYDYTKEHKCDLFKHLMWRRDKDTQFYLNTDDVDDILKVKEQVERLEGNIKFLVDEIFFGVQLMEGSVNGNYLEWVKSLRKKLRAFKGESDE
jgi:hypothetical protein